MNNNRNIRRYLMISITLVSIMGVGVAVGVLVSNITDVQHVLELFSPLLALLIDGLTSAPTENLLVTGSAVPPAGANTAIHLFEWTATQADGAHDLILTGIQVSGNFELSQIIVDCGAGPILGTNPALSTGQYIVSVDTSADGFITCSFEYTAGSARIVDWTHQIVDA